MRLKNVVGLSTLGAFALTMAMGCGDTSEVKVADAPDYKPSEKIEAKPLPKEITKGGGPGSSGNLGRNPGADPLQK
jgi:hypothetical protein